MAILEELSQGSLQYNGFTFPPAISTRVASVPVYDSTGRSVKYVVHTIQVETIVFPGADSLLLLNPTFPVSLTATDGVRSTATGLEGLRMKLLESGKPLVFAGKGFGAIAVNSETDVAYGPRPRIMQWEPLPNNCAARIVWAVDVAISECAAIDGYTGAASRILEKTYAADWSIDDHGYTTRTFSGMIEIAGSLRSDGVPLVIADQYRQYIDVLLPEGFKRQQSYQQSPDQRRLTWRITDTEIRSKYPLHRGVVDANVQHSVSSSGPTIGQHWLVGVSGSFSVANGHDKWFAWLMFLQVVKHRRQAAIDHARIKIGNDEGGATKKYGHAFPVSLSVNDDVFGTSISFALQWLVFTTYETMFKASGMFAKIDGSTWASYRSDMLNRSSTWRNRGAAGLTHNKSSGAMVNQCQLNNPAGLISDTVNRRDASATSKIFEADCPPKESSFVRFSPVIEEIDDTQTVSMYQTGGTPSFNTLDGVPSAGDQSAVVVHDRGSGRVRVRFTGVAVRMGYEIERPELVSYGGAAVLAKTGEHSFVQTPYGRSQGCRLWRAAWSVDYELSGQPIGKKIVTNPDWTQTP